MAKILPEHADHIILEEMGDAYVHIDPAELTLAFIAELKAAKDDKKGWKKYKGKLKEHGFDID